MKLNGTAEREINQADGITEWDKAIMDAEGGIKRLQLAIQTCREMKAKGEPWPGSLARLSAQD